MKKSYTELLQDIEKLKQEAEKARAAEVQGVIARIREAIDFYGLTPQDLGFGNMAGGRGVSRPAKYADGAGNVWSGRGPRPRWLKDALVKGANLEQFATQAPKS